MPVDNVHSIVHNTVEIMNFLSRSYENEPNQTEPNRILAQIDPEPNVRTLIHLNDGSGSILVWFG